MPSTLMLSLLHNRSQSRSPRRWDGANFARKMRDTKLDMRDPLTEAAGSDPVRTRASGFIVYPRGGFGSGFGEPIY